MPLTSREMTSSALRLFVVFGICGTAIIISQTAEFTSSFFLPGWTTWSVILDPLALVITVQL